MCRFYKISLTIIVICSLLFSFICVSAEETNNAIMLNPYFDINTSELIVSGTLSSQKGSVPMVFTLTLGNELIAAEQIVTGMPEDGVISFEFSGVPFANTTPSGDYKIYVSAGFIKAEENTIYTYDGPDKRFGAISDMNSAVTDNDTQALVKVFSDYKKIFVNGDDTLFELSETAVKKFADMFSAKGLYTLPDDYVSDENVDIIINQIEKVAQYYEEIIPIAYAADIKNETSFESWLKRYGEDKGFYLDDINTAFDEAVLGKYFDEALKTEGLYEKIAKAVRESDDFETLKKKMLDAAVLTLLESGKSYKIQEITENNPKLFEIDINSFGKLSDKNKLNVYQLLENMTFDSIEDYIAKFNSATEMSTPTQSGNNQVTGSSSSGGGSFGGGSATKVQPMPQDDKQETQNVIVFDDLDDCVWAHDAIKYLSDKRVISGKRPGVFEPSSNTTRAEFIKMVVLAFGFNEVTYSGTFDDVNSSDWFAPYVASAYSNGIATGSDGLFMPDSLISRQDMAVLLYRAKGMKASENERDVFTDSSAISDYAKSAVFAMYEKGIALGMGDGSFAPLKNATRAEAAQMIYKTIMN